MRAETAAAVLVSSDLERTAAWYRDALGWEVDLFGDPSDFASARRDGAVIMYASCVEPRRIAHNRESSDASSASRIRTGTTSASDSPALRQ